MAPVDAPLVLLLNYPSSRKCSLTVRHTTDYFGGCCSEITFQMQYVLCRFLFVDHANFNIG